MGHARAAVATVSEAAGDPEPFRQEVIVVVGGNARNVGKTSLICGILRAFPEFNWRVLKITPHEHRSASGDTRRFVEAGAREAHLNGVESFETGNWLIE